MDTSLTALAVLILVALAACAAAAEVSIRRVGRARAHHLVDQGRGGAPRLVRIIEGAEPCTDVLVFITIAATAGAIAVAYAEAIESSSLIDDVLTLAGITLALFVCAGLIPRALGERGAERVALAASGPVLVLGKLASPVAGVFRFLSRRRRGRRLEGVPESDQPESAEEDEDEMEEEERELIHSIFEFGDTIVREVMVPRTDMVVVRADSDLTEGLETITKAGFSRIPVYEGDTDNIVGVLYAKDLLKQAPALDDGRKVSAIARNALFVPEQKKVADLLREMQQARIHMAIVVDEYGGTAGLVTIEDLIEEIVGEIVDEYDQEEPLVEPLEPDTIRVSARLPIDEVNELLGVQLPDEEWDTVGGLVFGLTGHVPSQGDSIGYDSLQFTTEKVTGRRIQKVLIKKVGEPQTDSA